MAGGQSVIDAAVDAWGRIDGAVCVAGILRERMLFNMSEDEFDDVVRVHLKGTFTIFRAASAVMRKQDGGGSAHRLHVRRVGAWAPPRRPTTPQPRVASSASRTPRRSGSSATACAPTAIAPVARTRMSANVPMQLAENGDPEDVAPMAVYLLSDDVEGDHRTGVHGRRQQDRRLEPAVASSASMYGDGRWTPEQIAERLPVDCGHRATPPAREGEGDARSGNVRGEAEH